MATESIPLEQRYHVTIIDDNGVKLPINNLTREELDDFRHSHLTDDLDYEYKQGPMKPHRIGSLT